MPYTKRFPIHGSINQAVEYIMDKDKTVYKKNDYVSNLEREFKYIQNEDKTFRMEGSEGKGWKRFCTGINCDWRDATNEMYEHSKKFGRDNDSIQAYHTIQSFSWEDAITPEQVHKMGVELAQKLYPNFQCVVTTHCDRGHLHNHIICNATDKNGKKLRDDIYQSDTSLMKLREVSDTIADRYGCKILKDAPVIGYKDLKQEYMKQLNTAWSDKIKSEIRDLKPVCGSLDDLLRFLSLRGYEIKRGKHIAVRCYGMERFRRLDSLGEGFTQKELSSYFIRKRQSYISDEELDKYIEEAFSDFSKMWSEARDENKKAIRATEKVLEPERKYPKYMTIREEALEKIRKLNEQLSLLNQYKINSYDDLVNQIDSIQMFLNEENSALDKEEEELSLEREKKNLYKIYLQYYNIHATETDESIPKSQRNLSPTSRLWEEIDRELGHPTLDEVRKKYKKICEKEEQMAARVAQNSYKKFELEKLRELQMQAIDDNPLLIPSFEFSEKQICESPHEEEFKKARSGYEYIRLPYTDLYTYVLKNTITKNKYGRYQYYVIPDDTYTLYDKDGNEVRTIDADLMASMVQVQKESVAKMYANPERTENNPDMFVFTVDIKLFNPYKEGDDTYRIQIPTTDFYIDIPKENTTWIKENKTCQVCIHKDVIVNQYDKDGHFEQYKKIEDLKAYWEEKEKKFQKRN